MPIYEYQCSACGHRIEKLQKVSDEPLVHCEACGQDELKKLVSAAGFRLKGGGWYETDFKSKSDTQRNLSDSSTSSAASSGTQSDSKKSETSAGAD